MPLDLTQPYGTIQGDTFGRAFQQDGVTYKRDGTVWTAPSTYVEDIAAMKVNGSGSVVGLVRLDGTEATLGGEGGGATEFTELSDAPGSYAGHAYGIPRVNAAADGLEFANGLTVVAGGMTMEQFGQEAKLTCNSLSDTDYNDPSAMAEIGASATPTDMNAHMTLDLFDAASARATFKVHSVYSGAAVIANLRWQMQKDASVPFEFVGFDVAASDASARMTVGGVEYSIAKAIKVRIGSGTYFWPLFGPAA